jgi:hypothetical protein
MRMNHGIADYCVIVEIDVLALRHFQSSHSSPIKPFKPVSDGLEIVFYCEILSFGESK